MKMKFSATCQIGLDFFEFLKETDRAEIKHRSQLKDIYNLEFRNVEGRRAPNFWNVLNVLELSYKVEIYSTKPTSAVLIRFTPEVTAVYENQWHSHRSQQRLAPQNGSSGQRLAPQNGSSGQRLAPQNGSSGQTQRLAPQNGSSRQTQSRPTDVGEQNTGGPTRRPRTRKTFASDLMDKLNTNMAEFISDKHGICITSDHDFENGKVLGVEGVVCDGGVYEHVVHLYVENTGTEPVCFTYYSPLQWLKCFSLEDERRVTRANPLKLTPGDSYKIKVLFRTNLVGYYPATFAFEFKPDLPSSTAFHIVRIIEAKCVTSFGKELGPEAPYKPCVIPAIKFQSQTTSTIVDGLPPENLSVLRLKMEVGLKKYVVPTYMRQLIKSLKDPNSVRDARKSLLESPLSEKNYCAKFQLMLFLEEEQTMYDIRRYDIPKDDGEHASMVRDKVNKRLLVLEVEGVSENRPSVLRGDQLLVKPKGQEGVKYKGYVHSVELDQVKLGFSSQLVDRFIDDMKFSVEFIVNRLMLRVQHRALEFVGEYRLGKVLFPNSATLGRQQQQLQLPTLRLFDRNLEKNPEQYAAVQHIVAGSSKPAPYLLFGPPGTGKTVTMVEAIKQIEKTQGSCYILACAPSNSASDLLCKKIIEHVDKHKVFRMYASSRDPLLVPVDLRDCSNLEGETYMYPPKEELMKYKIIVTTLITAGRLVTGGIPTGHYTHVFVDEAGHAVETECLIPLAGLLHAESGQVVLAGDHKQLGPILRSPLAMKYGMDVSLLERLMRDFPLYQKDQEKFNNRFVTKLLKNYRSHPAILKIPNEMFYDGELQACADEMLRNSYCGWEYLPKRNFPVIFHGVTGIDQREKSSPSFFNVAEVEVLIYYLKKLFETQGKKGRATISPHEIGIIAPYRKQVQKIRKGLQKLEKDLNVRNIRHLKVGSVEEFQGQERRVILVSAVRSSRKYAEFDQQFSLGFVKNEKRFNVALTRAKALLIVVGNPIVLRSDPTWERFLQYCRDEGGYTGVSDTEDNEQVETRLVQLFAQLEVTVETAESVVQQQLEPEWRNDM